MQGERWDLQSEHVFGFVGDHMLVVALRRGPQVAKLSVGCADCGADIWAGVVSYGVSGDEIIRLSLDAVEAHLDACEAPTPSRLEEFPF